MTSPGWLRRRATPAMHPMHLLRPPGSSTPLTRCALHQGIATPPAVSAGLVTRVKDACMSTSLLSMLGLH